MDTNASWMDSFADYCRIPDDMGNATASSVTDEVGEVRELKKLLDKKEKFLSEWLKNECLREELREVKGQGFNATTKYVEIRRFSAEKAKGFLTTEQIESCHEDSGYYKLTVKARERGEQS